MNLMENARSYLAKMPPSISGSGGRTSLFNACAVLMRGFGLTEDTAYAIIRDWNASHCDPPWQERELRDKLREGAKANRPHGYLLQKDASASRAPSTDEQNAQWKREQRAQWPKFRQLSDESIHQIAQVRKVSPTAVMAVHLAGFLRGAMIDGHQAFITREADFAQARRCDGQPFTRRDGISIKAKNLPGSEGKFIGAGWLGGPGTTGPAGPVLLVEGCIGLLEATAAALAVDADSRGWTVVAATSASARMDAPWLERLRGRRVRIVPDNDAAGLEACAKWTVALRTVDAVVDAEMPPDGLKDLGPVAADPGRFTTYLNQLFTL